MADISTSARSATPGSGISSEHPLYTEFSDYWKQMIDTYKGSTVVKERGIKYLPYTSGMIADGVDSQEQAGSKAYAAYKARAHFPDVVKDAVESMIGVMHQKPPTIELPDSMEAMIENATITGESLEVLLRRINEQQLVNGRLGIMLDLPTSKGAAAMPYIATYHAPNIINWDEGRRDGIVVDNLNLVVLDESEYERQSDFSWEFERKFRVLSLGGLEDEQTVDEPQQNQPKGQGVYEVGVYREIDQSFSEEKQVAPSFRNTTLDEIPFVFINSSDTVPEPDIPPLMGLSELALTIYRGEADYRQALFMQGQDTLVIIGSVAEEEETRVGANAKLTVQQGGDAKYIGVDSQGLPEMRTALENDRAQAMQKGGSLLESSTTQRESGDALSIRVAAKTATLNQIAQAGAFGLQQLLRKAAVWVGADPEEVIVTPNLDFVADTLAGKELLDITAAKNAGAPISNQSIHKLMQEKGLTELAFDEEITLIEAEQPMVDNVDDGGDALGETEGGQE